MPSLQNSSDSDSEGISGHLGPFLSKTNLPPTDRMVLLSRKTARQKTVAIEQEAAEQELMSIFC